jgi:hypothetical protein
LIDALGADPAASSAVTRARIEAGDAAVVALLQAAEELDRHLAARASRRLRTTAQWRGVCRELFDDDLTRLVGLTAALRDDLRRAAFQVSDHVDRMTALPMR